jgi:hypothetical protein
LSRQFATRFSNLLIVCLGSTSRSVQQAQNCLARFVKRIAGFGLAVQLRRKGNDCIWYGRVTTAHGTYPQHVASAGGNSTTHLPPSRSPVDNSGIGRGGVQVSA